MNSTDFPFYIPEKYVFEGCIINDIIVHPVLAFSKEDDWYNDLINRAIPEMGEKYMRLFIQCKFQPFIFLECVKNV